MAQTPMVVEGELELLRRLAYLEATKTRREQSRFERYRDDPVGFVTDVLGEDPWAIQRRILERLWGGRRLVVPSCYASGKTWGAARAVLAWTSIPGSIAITTSAGARQVEGQLWSEVRLGWRDGLPGKLTPKSADWYISPGNFATGFSTDEPTRFQGWHSDRVLVIVDEAAGVAKEIWDVMEGQLSTADTAVLVIGNPADASGPFYEAAASSEWECVPISAFDTPNFANTTLEAFLADPDGEAARCEVVYPNLVSPRWAAVQLKVYGPDSFQWQCRVLGQFSTAGDKIIVPLTWFFDAIKRTLVPDRRDQVEMGLDIARYGNDDSAICIRQGPVILHLERKHGAGGDEVGGWAANRANKFGVARIKGDSGGLGGPVLDHMRAAGFDVVDVNAGSRARHPEDFVILRDELWWQYRDRFRDQSIAIDPRCDDREITVLRAQSSALLYSYDSRGRVKVESKADAQKRGIDSPDLADAACLAFYRAGSNVRSYLEALVEEGEHEADMPPDLPGFKAKPTTGTASYFEQLTHR